MKKLLTSVVLASLTMGPAAVMADTAPKTTQASLRSVSKADKKATLKKANEDYHAAMKAAKTVFMAALKKASADLKDALRVAKTKEAKAGAKDGFKKSMKDAEAVKKAAEKTARDIMKTAKEAVK